MIERRWRLEDGRFRNRVEAGALLADRLAGADLGEAVIAGLPRGGVPVAAEIARELDLPLDVVVVRKLGVPWQPELALGAVGEGGVRVLNPDIARLVPEDDVEAVTAAEAVEVDRRVAAWRGQEPRQDIAGRTVVVVDDGIATGATVRAAIEVLRVQGARRIVLAVPVVARAVADHLRSRVDDLVALQEPINLHAVGLWYDDFAQVDDAQVRDLLAEAESRGEPRGGQGASGSPVTGRGTVDLEIPSPAGALPALVTVPQEAAGLVLFAHGSGSSRLSPRNAAVAQRLHEAGLGTVLMDLLTEREARDRALVFDIGLLAERLLLATRWTSSVEGLHSLPLGYFGASTGGGAALWAAAEQPPRLRAVVSRGGRPDLAGPRLPQVRTPALLIVGELDRQVLELNRGAQEQLRCPNRLDVVPGATHLFEEPGALEKAAGLAAGWFLEHLAG